MYEVIAWRNVHLDDDNVVEAIIIKFIFCAPLHEECPKYCGHKGDPGLTSETCDAICESTQMILLWVRALGVENASHPWRLEI